MTGIKCYRTVLQQQQLLRSGINCKTKNKFDDRHFLRCYSVNIACEQRYNYINKRNVSINYGINHSGIQCKHLQNQRHAVFLFCTQKRSISMETYTKYLSPESPPIGYAQKTFESVHDITGLPWWASIAVTTFALRTVITLPLSIYSSYVLAKVECLQPELKELAKQLKGEVGMGIRQYGWTEKVAKAQFRINMKRLVKEAYVKENCHPFKASLVVWFQLPMWVSLSFSLRNMAGALPIAKNLDLPVLCPDLATEGLLWFPNLLLPDTTLILPILLGAMNLAIIEMNSLRSEDPTKFQKVITNVLRGFSLFMVPIAASVPSCMALYWTCSSFFGLSQNVIMKFPVVRRAVGIPETPSESNTPFKDMLRIAKMKYGKKRNIQEEKQ